MSSGVGRRVPQGASQAQQFPPLSAQAVLHLQKSTNWFPEASQEIFEVLPSFELLEDASVRFENESRIKIRLL